MGNFIYFLAEFVNNAQFIELYVVKILLYVILQIDKKCSIILELDVRRMR